MLVEGEKITAVERNLQASDAAGMDASGLIVVPEFIDAHHQQFERVRRGFLSDAVLTNYNSGTAAGSTTYNE